MTHNILILGGSGYLGQFLVYHFHGKGYTVSYTYNSSGPLPCSPTNDGSDTTTTKNTLIPYKVDLATGQGLQALFTVSQDESSSNTTTDSSPASSVQYHAIINCAAISQPIACEKDPSLARAINIPTALLDILTSPHHHQQNPPLLIHISTDQVYDGASKSWWTESDECSPVNEYGRSKLEGERAILQRYPKHVILRSSLIYGPEPPCMPVSRGLFLQFIEKALQSTTPTTFFTDEYRCPIYVQDIVQICDIFIRKSSSDNEGLYGVYNMGGPERLSRFDMATLVARAKQCESDQRIVGASSSTVDRGVASPADISIDTSLLVGALGGEYVQTRFVDAVERSFSC